MTVGNNTYAMLMINTRAPEGPLYTHDSVATHVSDSIMQFADDTTEVNLITNNDETAYREEVRALVEWCPENNLCLNKTKELIVDYRRQQREHTPHTQTGPQWRGSKLQVPWLAHH